jgi:hypothetical protein
MYIFFLMVGGLCACGRGRYYNKEQWRIPWKLNYYRLKDSPRIVTEYLFEATSDTGQRMKDTNLTYYCFNRQGDIVSRRMVFGDFMTTVAVLRYDDNGTEMKNWVYRHGGSDTFWNGNRAMGGGWFKSYSSRPGKGAMTWLTRFQKEGDEQTSKGYADSAVSGKPERTIYSFYQGQRLLKRIVWDADGLLEQRYFYGDSDSPDSVEWIAGRRVAQREIFHNNRWGDPALYLKIRDQDTVEFNVFTYVYDKRGNWTRQRDSTRAKVMITEREIVY